MPEEISCGRGKIINQGFPEKQKQNLWLEVIGSPISFQFKTFFHNQSYS